MRKEVERSAMIRLFEEIRDAFPRLSMRLDENPPNVDLNVDIPQQPGLAFDMNLNLQGDELHLSAGAFCTDGPGRSRDARSRRCCRT